MAQDGAGEAVLSAFLAHLTAAEDEEHGLDTGAVSGADTVKLMTVHAAKGLEWPVVAVPGLARSTAGGAAVFPAKPATSTSWTANARLLPFPLRGDRTELPAAAGLEPDDVRATSTTNARATPARSGGWPTSPSPGPSSCCCAPATTGARAATVVGPSVFLEQAREACLDGRGRGRVWAEPPSENPVVGSGRTRRLAVGRPARRSGGAGGAASRVACAADRQLRRAGRRARGARPRARRPQAVVDRWDDDLRRLAEEARRRRPGARRRAARRCCR